MKIDVFVATHKKIDNNFNSKIYKYLQVGTAKNVDLGYISDNTGENISSKNKSYCELTGLYWIWKNCHSDFVGLCHYRRFFCKKNIVTKKFKILNDEDIIKLMDKYELILPREANLSASIYDHYCENHYKRDIDMCLEAIKVLYPSYIEIFNKTIYQNKIRLFNMFIGKKQIMDEYFLWLFNILEYVENNIDINDYDTYQKRVFGYLSERLFNVWINFNKEKILIKELFVINTEDGKVL